MGQLITTEVRNQAWLAMVRSQKQSGLTIKSWCELNHISEHCFYYRQQKLREFFAGQIPSFAELLPPEQSPATDLDNFNSTACVEAGNIRIMLSNAISEDLLEKIVKVVSHAQ